MNSRWIWMSLAAAAALAGCDHKKKSEQENTVKDGSGAGVTGSGSAGATVGSGSAGATVGSDTGGSGVGSGSDAGSGSGEPALPSSADNVREPVAADLEEYTKDLPGKGDKLLAEIATSEGTFHCELYPKAAMTVANFIGLATGKKAWKDPRTGKTMKATPYFDGLKFHRVAQGFMIQGGDPLGNGTGGPGYTMDQEVYKDLVHEAGTLSMANTGRPHSSGSQFFIMEARNKGLDGGYSVFGKCKEVDLVKKITALQKPGTELPSKLVTIDKVTISKGK
jgi:peptidyl-prolyl cis-trans isomerase A (cyclophilin A)